MAFEKKFKKIIKNIFPSKTNPEIQKGNIKDLVIFCNNSADQLKNIGEYLFSKVEQNINKKKKINIVKACIFIISELIVRVRNILLYGPAIKIMDLLLQQTGNPDLQIEATKTFAQYASVQGESFHFQVELASFIQWFITMSRNNSTNDIQKRQIRAEGLKGITAYVSLLDLSDELDTFISKNYNQSVQSNNTNNNNNNNSQQSNENIIYIFLDNMQYTDSIQQQQQQLQSTTTSNNEDSTSSNNNNNEDSSLPADVKFQATECLKDISRRVENVTVGTLIYSICNYLDQHQKWGTPLSNECLRAVTENIKQQSYSILVTKYLSHLEMQHPTSTTSKIVQSTISIIKSANTSNTLIITSLLNVLVRSIEVSNRQPPNNDIDDQVKLQGVIIESIGEISKKAKSTKTKVEIMQHIMSFLKDIRSSFSKSTSPIYGMNVIILDLVQCILQVSSTLHDINPQLNEFTKELIDLSNSELTSSEARIFIQKILTTILLPGNRSFEQFINSVTNTNTTTTNTPTNNTINDGVDEYLNDNLSLLRSFIFNSFTKLNNQPNNLIALFRNLVVILYRCKNKEVVASIPMMLQLQQQASTLPFRLNRSVHLTISSYFLMVSRVYSSITMEQYISSITEKRNTTNTSCRYLGYDQQHGLIIVNNKHKYNTETKDATPDNELLIDHEKISDILSNISQLSNEYSDIKQKLVDNNQTKPPTIKDDLDKPINNSTTTTSTTSTTTSTSSISKLPIIGTNSDVSSGSSININRSNTIQVLKKSNNSEIPSTSGSKPSESSTFSFESFKKFTDIVDTSNGFNTAANGTTNPTNANANSQRNINNIVLSKDLTYEFVSNKCEEVKQVNQEYNQLLNILDFTETQRQAIIKSQKQNQHPLNINTNTTINNDSIDTNELSPSCTLMMNIQNVLEKVF